MSAARLPRRLLMTADAVGGVWVYSLDLAGGLVDAGVRVTLAVLGPAPNAAQREAAEAHGIELLETGLELDWTAQSAAALTATIEALRRSPAAREADIIQLHSPALVGDERWPAPVLAVAHSCVGTWWAAMRGAEPPPPDFAWRMAAMKVGLDHADTVIAPTAAFAAALARTYGVRPVHAVHNGRDAAASAAFEVGHGVLACGRLWDEAKNMFLLDQAAAFMDVPVIAAGATLGPNGAVITLEAVTALGALPEAELRLRMAACRIFASPARYEPFGLGVLEAAQLGRPLVLADIPTFRELWDDAALFLPADDAPAWAAALTELHADTDECARLGALARRRAERFIVSRLKQAMLDQYARLLPASVAAA